MQKTVLFFALVLALAGCTGNTSGETTTVVKQDTTVTRDTTAYPENTVTPPASNGQY